jgi:limonene-1,2-epoxide hydrolase
MFAMPTFKARLSGRKLLIAAGMLFGGLSVAACSSDDAGDEQKLAVVRNMISSWNEMDWERTYNLFTIDARLHSMMSEPLVGRDAIRARLSQLTGGLESIELQIINIGVVGDDVVIERVDDFTYKGKRSRIPVVGVLQVEGDQVSEWREYYDKASLVAALTPDSGIDESKLLQALVDKLQTDWNSGDMQAYLDAYADSEDLDLIFGNRIVHGKAAMAALFTGTWTDEEKMGDFRASDVSVKLLAPGTAVVNGQFAHQFPDELVSGAFSHILQKDSHGEWRIVHEHTSRKQGID